MPLNQSLNPVHCLNCRNTVDLATTDNALSCPECSATYPVFQDIPILLKDSNANLAAAWMQYRKSIADNFDRQEEVRDALGRQPERSELLGRGIDAYEQDNAYLRGLQKQIEDVLPRKEINSLEDEGKLPKQYSMAEALGFFYRDWCGTDRAEDELSVILDTFRSQIERYADDADSVLVPGAGAGRFACEMAHVYDSAFAFDYSLHMAQIFYDILTSGITLHRVNFRSNAIRTEDVVVRFDLSLDNVQNRIRRDVLDDRLSYFVGNALDVPLPGNSLSAVACLYFIDIVPVREHMIEIRRLLKRGGLLINFGPLRYMRGDVANMLSGEEIMDLYRESGFDILAHDVVPNTQLASSPVITRVQSDNLMFVARKR